MQDLMLEFTFSVLDRKYFYGQTCTKNCQFNLTFGTYNNSNMHNFFHFRPGSFVEKIHVAFRCYLINLKYGLRDYFSSYQQTHLLFKDIDFGYFTCCNRMFHIFQIKIIIIRIFNILK